MQSATGERQRSNAGRGMVPIRDARLLKVLLALEPHQLVAANGAAGREMLLACFAFRKFMH